MNVPRSAPVPAFDAIRLYRPGDEPALLDCLREAFAFEPDTARWRHLHCKGPAGPSLYPLVWEEGRVVSGVALLPRAVTAFGRDGIASHTIDSMTRFGWRGRGVRSAAAAFAWRLARERGALAVFSFANAESLPGLLRQPGRRAVGDVPVMLRPLRPVRGALAAAKTSPPLVRLGLGRPYRDPPHSAAAGPIPDGRIPALRAARRRPGWSPVAFDERHTRLFRGAEEVPPIAMIRDAAYLRWRYVDAFDHPYVQHDVVRDGQLNASVVVRSTDLRGIRMLLVMEWAWRAGARRDAVGALREAVRLGRAAGAHAVSALAMPGTAHRRMLRRLAFVGLPARLNPRRVTLNVAPAAGALETSPWYSPASWHLTWGDGFLL